MSLRRLVTLNLFATALCVGSNVGVGYWIGQSAVHVAKEISHYGLLVALGLLVIMVVTTIRRDWRLAYQA
jgi:membrane protein DedA with SNARE-associated domain